MAKKIVASINFMVAAGKAAPSPQIGSVLGPRGLNIMEFCKAFNAQTQSYTPGAPVPVVISIYEDKTYKIDTKTSPASYFIKQYAKIDKGSSATKKEAFVGRISLSDCREIAKIKMQDLNAFDLDAAEKIICGTAESMGIEVIK